MALSPGESIFVTAPSIAPVPEEENMRTSFLLPKMCLRFFLTSSTTTSNMGLRWWTMGSAIFSNTSGGIWVGPGASKYRLSIFNLLNFNASF
ncbi:MAG: hypothetical protein A4E60_03531 [Syntrophorhabdus sp. PtaB.Bin047]|nr:MAG: hypothetical protein A4E60_03531 [Syntrophorhabdus sp. PtaB.Bin047]